MRHTIEIYDPAMPDEAVTSAWDDTQRYVRNLKGCAKSRFNFPSSLARVLKDFRFCYCDSILGARSLKRGRIINFPEFPQKSTIYQSFILFLFVTISQKHHVPLFQLHCCGMGISNMEDTPWKAWKMNPRINPRSTDEMVSNNICYYVTYVHVL